MKRTVSPKTAISIIVVFFGLTICTLFYLKNKPKDNYFDLEFRGEIIKIVKYYRGRYNIVLRVSNHDSIEISDYNFRNYKEKITLGDSLVKNKQTNCFYYKNRLTVIAQNCDNIHLASE